MREFYPLPESYERIRVSAEGTLLREIVPVPDLGPRDLLFKLILAGFMPDDTAPAAPHTHGICGIPVGEIAAVGDAVSGWNPLDRALILPGEGTCASVGEYVHWRAEEGRGPEPFKLPEDIPAEEASLLPAAAGAARILRKAALPPGGRLLVLGLGLVGQILILLARHHRVEQIAAADPSPTLRAKAEFSGATRVIRIPEEPLHDRVLAETGGQGVHAAAVMLADPHWLAEASRLLAPRGALLVASGFAPGFTLTVAPAWVHRHEIRIQGVRGWSDRDLREALRSVEQGLVNAESLVSKRIPWSDLADADLAPATWNHATHLVLLGPDA